MRRIQEQVDAFDERNLFLQLGLGLLSWCRRLDALVEANAPPKADLRAGASVGEDVADAPLDSGDRALVDFALGLIALRDRVMDAAERSAIDVPRERPASAQRAADVASGDLLR